MNNTNQVNKTNGTVEVRSVEELLQGSRAAESFKAAVRELAQTEKLGHPAITANGGAPAVKVLRVVLKLLERHPELELERVAVQGQSGCSDFRGKAVVEPGGKPLEFVWDCAWRAREQGWKDPWGEPDQIKAARELGYQCFEQFALRG